MLAGKDHQAGVLLHGVVHWIKHASATIPKVPGKWVANDHEFWKRETQLSRDQLSRNLKYLAERGLIERRQWWWGRSNILYVRPTQKVSEFLSAATTWPAAYELVKEAKNHQTEISKIADPSSVKLLNCKLSNTAQLTSADLLISNNIETEHTTQHKVLTSGSSAMPTYPVEKMQTAQKNSGKKKTEFSFVDCFEKDEMKLPVVVTVAEASAVWLTSMASHFPGHATGSDLAAKQKGALALIVQGLENLHGSNGIVKFQHHTADILEFGLHHWKKWGKKSVAPDPVAFLDVLDGVVNAWHQAGCPPHPGVGLTKTH